MERLLVDRALGGLSSDVTALLDAYLENEPAQASLRREIDDTVRLAGRALPRPPSVSLPPPKFIAFPQMPLAKPFHRSRWWPAELAAVFVLGLALGLMALRPSQPLVSGPESPGLETARRSPAPQSTPSAFWSMARLGDLELKASASPPPRISWTSPVRKPQLNP